MSADRWPRWPALLAQKLLFRLMRPYWWRQRAIQTALVAQSEAHTALIADVLLKAEARAIAAERNQRQALETVWSAVHELDASLTKRLKDQAVPTRDGLGPFSVSNQYGARVLRFRSAKTTQNDGVASDERQAYVALLKNGTPVVEIGCDHGELLNLLREAGVNVVRVEIDEGMLQRGRRQHRSVERSDGIGHQSAGEDASRSGSVGSHVGDDLPVEDLMSFLKPILPDAAVDWCRRLGVDAAYILLPLDKDKPESGAAHRAYAVVARDEPDGEAFALTASKVRDTMLTAHQDVTHRDL